MTNLEAIRAKLSYPLSANAYLLVLADRELVSTAVYDATTDKRAMDLAQADLIYVLCTQPHFTEGGYSVTVTDRYALLKVADSIYRRYGIRDPFKPTGKFVQKW
jgi:hypothetical protein